ncbi:hypothetical protein [Haladaptatus caseinilyticus]|uniref:hypothetical protein n=1 Tax=Haladaptatus caseinilyticus TaxID=2993314 RepID=UPI00224AEAAB|nr:hypothetical protein [Haladaptatus caseinilyticus]
MIFKIDYFDYGVHLWSQTDSGVEYRIGKSYTPTVYISAHGNGSLADAHGALSR